MHLDSTGFLGGVEEAHPFWSHQHASHPVRVWIQGCHADEGAPVPHGQRDLHGVDQAPGAGGIDCLSGSSHRRLLVGPQGMNHGHPPPGTSVHWRTAARTPHRSADGDGDDSIALFEEALWEFLVQLNVLELEEGGGPLVFDDGDRLDHSEPGRIGDLNSLDEPLLV